MGGGGGCCLSLSVVWVCNLLVFWFVGLSSVGFFFLGGGFVFMWSCLTDGVLWEVCFLCLSDDVYGS